MKWWEVRLDVPKESSEAVASLFHEYPDVQGVAMEGAVADRPLHPDYGEWFAEGITESNKVTVIVYIPENVYRESIRHRVIDVLHSVQNAGLDTHGAKEHLLISLVDESSWESAWKEHLHPMKIGKTFIIVPKWEQNELAIDENRHSIILEPGMAFGTGTHETTQMCLEAIEEFSPKGKKVLDVGCGTAVLSIAAALHGAREVLAVDIDPIAVQVASQNIAENGLSKHVHAKEGNLLHGFEKDTVFDMILANILRDIVVKLTPDAVMRLSPGGVFITSGYIREQTGAVHKALHHAGLQITRVWQKNDWMCTAAVKPS